MILYYINTYILSNIISIYIYLYLFIISTFLQFLLQTRQLSFNQGAMTSSVEEHSWLKYFILSHLYQRLQESKNTGRPFNRNYWHCVHWKHGCTLTEMRQCKQPVVHSKKTIQRWSDTKLRRWRGNNIAVTCAKKSLLLPMHWTSPCGSLREMQGELPFEALDYCMFVCLLYVCCMLLYVYYLNTLA